MHKRFRGRALAMLAAVAALPPAGHAQTDVDTTLGVMTYNAGQGTDFVPLLRATDAESYRLGVAQVLRQVQATQPDARMRTVAAQIAQLRPALVSLQELNRWKLAPLDPATGRCGAGVVNIDMLVSLREALRAQGLDYRVAAQVAAYNPPPLLGRFGEGALHCVQVLGRNVILARAGLPASAFEWRNPRTGRLDAPAQPQDKGDGVPAPVGTVPTGQAWVSVEARVDGRWLRVLGAQLDERDAQRRRDNGVALRAQAATSVLPVVLAFSANAQAAPTPPDDVYTDFIAAGWRDAWQLRHPGLAGYTCCRAPALTSRFSALSRRTDLVLLRGAVAAPRLSLVGAWTDSRTPSGLWSSDHAGVMAQVAPGTAP
jgi:hypothetical protein